jgi:excisionase family DNA binding protein
VDELLHRRWVTAENQGDFARNKCGGSIRVLIGSFLSVARCWLVCRVRSDSKGKFRFFLLRGAFSTGCPPNTFVLERKSRVMRHVELRAQSTDAREFRLLTVRDVAETLRVDEKTVRRKIERGLIPAYRLGPPGNSIRVAADELEAWLESQPEDAA